MKCFFSFLSLFFSISVNSQIDTIERSNHVIIYDQDKKQPIFVSYHILCKKDDVKYPRTKLDFYKEKKYKTSTDKDYVKNVYDKGHMMPYEAVSCDSNLARLSFSYLNCAMQHERLNRNIWRLLEMVEKRLGDQNNIYVEIHILFEDSKFTKSGTQIPSKFIKKIWINGVLKRKYEFPNNAPKSNNLKDFEIF